MRVAEGAPVSDVQLSATGSTFSMRRFLIEFSPFPGKYNGS